MTDLSLFWEKVRKGAPDECWPWLGYLSESGHGITKRDGKAIGSHRVAFELCCGPIPKGLLVRHQCDNAACVNPRHLTLGTVQDNNGDRLKRSGYQWMRRPRPRAEKKWKGGPKPKSVKDRILAAIVTAENGCWVWQLAKLPSGHGLIKVGGKSERVHRISYAAFVGPIPAGLSILHNCDNASCVNPDHLRPGTHADNMADMKARGRAAKGKNNYFGRVKYQGSDNWNSKLTEDAARQIVCCDLSVRDASKRFGVSECTIAGIRSGHSWNHATGIEKRARRTEPLCGTEHWHAKLTDDDVRAIRSGMTVKEAMRQFSMSEGAIRHIIKRRSWAHVA